MVRAEILRSVLVASLALVAFVVSSCGGGGGNGTEAAATATGPAETDAAVATDAGREPITAAEERWLKLVTRYNERFEREYLRGGTVTHGSMRREARLFRDCRAMLRRAGDLGRLGPAAKRVRRACDRLEKAAGLLGDRGQRPGRLGRRRDARREAVRARARRSQGSGRERPLRPPAGTGDRAGHQAEAAFVRGVPRRAEMRTNASPRGDRLT